MIFHRTKFWKVCTFPSCKIRPELRQLGHSKIRKFCEEEDNEIITDRRVLSVEGIWVLFKRETLVVFYIRVPRETERHERKKDLSSDEKDASRKSRTPATVVTANGEVQTNEEAQVYVQDLDLFVTEQLLEETPAVLSLGELCP